MVFKDYYKILDLNDITSNQNEIKTAYKKQAKKFHPDKSNQNTEEIFNDISEAYFVLSDKEKKRKYDRLWLSYIGRKKLPNLTYINNKRKHSIGDELINMFIGHLDFKEKKIDKSLKENLNITTSIDISLKEAFNGTKKEIILNDKTLDSKNIEIKVPSGTLDGDILSFKNLGKSNEDKTLKGNLNIKINVINDTDFEIKGLNLISDLKIYPWDAILGSKFVVNGIDEEISVIIPPLSTNEQKLVLKNKGLKNRKNKRGNLIINLKLILPNIVNDEEKELYEKLKKIHKKKNNFKI